MPPELWEMVSQNSRFPFGEKRHDGKPATSEKGDRLAAGVHKARSLGEAV